MGSCSIVQVSYKFVQMQNQQPMIWFKMSCRSYLFLVSFLLFFHTNDGCSTDCQCNRIGSRTLVCNQDGRCDCKQRIAGLKCNQCLERRFGFPGCHGHCQEYDQCRIAAVGVHDGDSPSSVFVDDLDLSGGEEVIRDLPSMEKGKIWTAGRVGNHCIIFDQDMNENLKLGQDGAEMINLTNPSRNHNRIMFGVQGKGAFYNIGPYWRIKRIKSLDQGWEQLYDYSWHPRTDPNPQETLGDIKCATIVNETTIIAMSFNFHRNLSSYLAFFDIPSRMWSLGPKINANARFMALFSCFVLDGKYFHTEIELQDQFWYEQRIFNINNGGEVEDITVGLNGVRAGTVIQGGGGGIFYLGGWKGPRDKSDIIYFLGQGTRTWIQMNAKLNPPMWRVAACFH